jgi:hypothetical protein
MTQQIFVRCPMDGTEHLKYCGLVDHYKETGTTHECLHRDECSEIKTYMINDKEKLNEIIQRNA